MAVRDGEMPKGVESMSADEIAATQASEVAITVGDPVPAGEQNATVEIQGQPIGRSPYASDAGARRRPRAWTTKVNITVVHYHTYVLPRS